ncbi:2,4-dichlorophenol 6-monooxygenase [Streptacidiphilus sp. MAP12-33]|uniref:FAD-dependent oxidoreductase n=1 Tax=Streptacidiphilus sp. MAP12-33 TaxID=3156266 RepID=UPI0035180522
MAPTADDDFDTDVLVVGSGPAGGAAAVLLATYGVRTTMVSKHGWVADTPRAHITNQRTMEVLRDLGLQAEAEALGTPQQLLGESVFCTSLVGEEIARIRTWGTEDERLSEYAAASPCTVIDLPQPYLEPLLVGHAARRGAAVRFDTEFLGLTQDEHGVTSVLRDRLRGDEFQVRSRYLVGADGGRSRVAEQVGLPFRGEEGRGGSMNIVFRADLGPLVEHRPGVLYWVVRPGEGIGGIGMGALRMVRPWHTWMAVWGYDIDGPEPVLDEGEARRIVHRMLGDDRIEVEIESTSLWTVNQRHATRYCAGRVFCAGDAVHRHPPSNGLGSNTSIQDAHNLAWKLAAVLHGQAGPGLLDTYSAERAPVGEQVVSRANRSTAEFVPLFRALGLGDGLASADPGAGLRLARAADRAGARARRELAQAMQFKHYEFSAHGVELNQRYRSAAVLEEPGAEEREWARDPELYAQPCARPGAKVPHVWLVDGRGHRISTLDLVGGGRFTVLTGLAGHAWETAAERCERELGVPLRVVRIDAEGARDAYGAWQRVNDDLDEEGCLLVRPDGFIAWRQDEPVADAAQAAAQLAKALAAVLHR